MAVNLMELVIIHEMDPLNVVTQAHRILDGTVEQIDEVEIYRFKTLKVKRKVPGPIQVDGELVETKSEFEVRVKERALNIIIPDEKA